MRRRRVALAAHLGQRVAFQYTHGVLAGEVEGDAIDLFGLVRLILGQQPGRVAQARQGALEGQTAAVVGFEQFTVFRLQVFSMSGVIPASTLNRE